VRRIGLARLVTVGVVAAVGLVLWLAILSVSQDRASGAATVTVRLAAAAVPPKTPTVPAVSGSTCFVSVPECSQTPCVELIGAGSATAVYAPTVPAPRTSCGRAHNPGVVTAVRRGPLRTLGPPNPYGRILRSLRARLSRRFP